jgi:hypothetical protein
MDVVPRVRAEFGLEIDAPVFGPDLADYVIGAGTHGEVTWQRGTVSFFARYDMLDFHGKFPLGTRDDLVHGLSLGMRAGF